MSQNDGMLGMMFSRLYLERGAPQKDSKRFRNRLIHYIDDLSYSRAEATKQIARELGLTVGQRIGARGEYIYYYEAYLTRADLPDVLSTITIVHNAIYEKQAGGPQDRFRDFVNRAFREENLQYSVDDFGGVHYYHDEEFERSRRSVVLGLGAEKYRAANEAFEDAHAHLLRSDTLTAVRRAFDAVENVFKIHFEVPRLGASEINKNLNRQLASLYDGRVLDASKRMSASFGEWVNASHSFRHAPGEADPSPPTLDMAVLLISGSATYLRWLVQLESAS